MLKPVAWTELFGKTIAQTRYGHTEASKSGPYGAITLVMNDGSEYVVTQSWGEVNLLKVS